MRARMSSVANNFKNTSNLNVHSNQWKTISNVFVVSFLRYFFLKGMIFWIVALCNSAQVQLKLHSVAIQKIAIFTVMAART
jgi:hypothetical protein